MYARRTVARGTLDTGIGPRPTLYDQKEGLYCTRRLTYALLCLTLGNNSNSN